MYLPWNCRCRASGESHPRPSDQRATRTPDHSERDPAHCTASRALAEMTDAQLGRQTGGGQRWCLELRRPLCRPGNHRVGALRVAETSRCPDRDCEQRGPVLHPAIIVAEMANRLGAETSPYLLQHADNPVDWYPWGDEAFERARAEDKPVLLSVGYAACHWCHVMEHESFENAETASLMNERFVNIKVDREERPDVDSLYMDAVVALTGHGGWPMTVFLTAEGEPFLGGTYYPPEPRHGLPSFRQVLGSVSDAYRERRADVV